MGEKIMEKLGAGASVVAKGAVATHDYLGDKLLKLFGGLFMEVKDQDGDGNSEWVASLGRVAFWIVFGHLMWIWSGHSETKVPDGTELNAFYALLAYAGVKIGKEAIVDGAEAWKGTGEK
ncbi:MAG TPA: hypothetical protein VLI71_07830 [Gammaproteobacteria bacterium]|nr:hypothetical protein [Gammaproteobacteria bacterium]